MCDLHETEPASCDDDDDDDDGAADAEDAAESVQSRIKADRRQRSET